MKKINLEYSKFYSDWLNFNPVSISSLKSEEYELNASFYPCYVINNKNRMNANSELAPSKERSRA